MMDLSLCPRPRSLPCICGRRRQWSRSSNVAVSISAWTGSTGDNCYPRRCLSKHRNLIWHAACYFVALKTYEFTQKMLETGETTPHAAKTKEQLYNMTCTDTFLIGSYWIVGQWWLLELSGQNPCLSTHKQRSKHVDYLMSPFMCRCFGFLKDSPPPFSHTNKTKLISAHLHRVIYKASIQSGVP